MPRPIAAAFAVWAPAHRAATAFLVATTAIAGLIVYIENRALQTFTASLIAGVGSPPPSLGPIVAPVALVVAFVVARLTRTGVVWAQQLVQARIEVAVRAELELELLDHLLRKGDRFFAERSPGEIIGRLGTDVQRAGTRRTVTIQAWQSVALLIGNVYFFASQSVALAGIACATIALGALATARATRPMQGMDKAYLSEDDRVKSRFEDLLNATPEIQVGNLFAPVRAAFAAAVRVRSAMVARYLNLDATLTALDKASYIFSLVALLMAVVLVLAGTRLAAAALVAVTLKALPELFANVSDLVFRRVSFQRIATSEQRLLEYESPGDDAPVLTALPDAGTARFEARGATYRYATPTGGAQGGVAEVSIAFERGTWTAIAGPAGSGKSTLLQMLLGRLAPQTGEVCWGDVRLAALGADTVAGVLAFMPQRHVTLDGSVAENLRFRRHREIDDTDLRTLDAVGLGAVLRTRALELAAADASPALRATVERLRDAARTRVLGEGVAIVPYEGSAPNPGVWLLESIVRGIVDRDVAREALRAATALLSTASRDELAALGRAIVGEQRHLLELASHAEFAKLVSRPVPEPIWALRRRALAEPEDAPLLAAVALATEPRELDGLGDRIAAAAIAIATRPADVRRLAQLAPIAVAFDATGVQDRLSIRDNLLRGTFDAPNQRAAQRSDDALVALISEAGCGDDLLRLGLTFLVGRGGSRFSGGQRQLLSLARTLGCGTPVMILDEPTSALDPASCARVCAQLAAWKADRILITVTHDPELMRHADRVVVLEAGRLSAIGPFAELEQTSAAFRRTLARD